MYVFLIRAVGHLESARTLAAAPCDWPIYVDISLVIGRLFLSHPAPPPTPRLFLYNSPSVDFVNTVKCILISSTCFWYTQTNSWSYWFGTTVHLFRDGCVQQRLMMSDRSDRLIICYFTFSDRAGVGEECMWRHCSIEFYLYVLIWILQTSWPEMWFSN